jgi:hypothetical protein
LEVSGAKDRKVEKDSAFLGEAYVGASGGSPLHVDHLKMKFGALIYVTG